MSDVTQILNAIEHGDAKPLMSCCRWSMTNCAGWRRTKWLTKLPAIRSNPRPWCMKPGFTSAGDQQPTWQNRAHFFGAAAEAMRRILVDRARAKQALETRR